MTIAEATIIFVCAIAVQAVFGAVKRSTDPFGQSVYRSRAKVNRILQHLKIEDKEILPPGMSQGVVDLIEQGLKIQAIKLYREQSGRHNVGLKEAKDAIEGVPVATLSRQQVEAQVEAKIDKLLAYYELSMDAEPMRPLRLD